MSTPLSPRFVWSVGAYRETYPDMPELPFLTLWDRQERKPVVIVSDDYAQTMALEGGIPHRAPYSALAEWLNAMPTGVLSSEGIPDTVR